MKSYCSCGGDCSACERKLVAQVTSHFNTLNPMKRVSPMPLPQARAPAVEGLDLSHDELNTMLNDAKGG